MANTSTYGRRLAQRADGDDDTGVTVDALEEILRRLDRAERCVEWAAMVLAGSPDIGKLAPSHIVSSQARSGALAGRHLIDAIMECQRERAARAQ